MFLRFYVWPAHFVMDNCWGGDGDRKKEGKKSVFSLYNNTKLHCS